MSILDERVPYLLVDKDITLEEAREMFRAFVILNVFFYILNLEYRKKLETTFLLIQKLFLRTSVSVKCYPKCK